MSGTEKSYLRFPLLAKGLERHNTETSHSTRDISNTNPNSGLLYTRYTAEEREEWGGSGENMTSDSRGVVVKNQLKITTLG